MSSARQRLTLIAGLYVSQAIPLGFFIIALPAIMRSRGLPLEHVGLLGALALPWLLKFLWAPLVDRYGSHRTGHYRSWIIPLQLLTVLSVVVLAGVDISRGLMLLVLAGGAFMFLAATQDVATDGLAVRNLPAAERGRANGVQVGGYYLGQILGGGVALIVYHRFGWTAALLAMAVVLALPLLPAIGFRETPGPAPVGERKVDFGALRRFAARPGAGTWLLILLLFRTGEAMALMMATPMLVDHGLSLADIGLALGLTGSVGALLGALTGGGLISRVGRKRSLVMFGVLQTLALCLYVIPAVGVSHLAVIHVVVMVAAFTGGMATAALYTCMMDRCDLRTAATDFTLQQSVCAAGPLMGTLLSGFSAARLGYPLHFVLCAVITLTGVLVVTRRLTVRHAMPVAASPLVEIS